MLLKDFPDPVDSTTYSKLLPYENTTATGLLNCSYTLSISETEVIMNLYFDEGGSAADYDLDYSYIIFYDEPA